MKRRSGKKSSLLGGKVTMLSLLVFVLLVGFYVYQYGWEVIMPPADAQSANIESVSEVSTASVAKTSSAKKTSAKSVLSDESLLPASRADLSEQILRRKGYTVSYNKDTRNPNWVAWTLTKEHTAEVVERPKTSPFHEDDDVPDPKANRSDYKGSGWSRGHMCPAGDCRWDADAMYESFLLTNICPQAGKLNTGVWNQIEKSCREWAIKYGEVMIVTGPIYFKKSKVGTIGASKVKVPDAFFKVVLAVKNGKHQGIGFICRNEDKNATDAGTTESGRKRSKKELYVHSIDDVERITGYDFFSGLADDIETSVEALADYEQW